MKILHILDHSLPSYSGYVFRTLYILKEQHALGWQTAHLTSPKHPVHHAQSEIFEDKVFYRTKTPRFMNVPFIGELSLIHALTRRIEEVIKIEKPDIIHAHSPALNGTAAIAAAKKYNIPVVYEIRGLWEDAAVSHGTNRYGSLKYKMARALETRVMKNADAITCICEGLRSEIILRGIKADKITIIPNAVNTEEFPVIGSNPDIKLMKKFDLTKGEVIGFLGSFYNYEGLDILIDALPEIIKVRPNVKLLLVGGGPCEEALKKQAASSSAASSIIFAGKVPHQEVNLYYNLIDLLVYPRKSMRVTEMVTPLKPLEAMSLGRVFMASSVGGHKELIQGGITGYLFTPDNPKILAEKAVQILSVPDDWQSLIKNGRHFVENERTWKNSVHHYKALYQKILHKTLYSIRKN